ncbi:MAG TPA: TetR/AcrR family transcriptional regulator [Vicinamibacteria bacterium]
MTERREREREEVRTKILDAARELFMTEGYEKVTMRRIAEAIEYSPTAIYLHFEDKDDLVLALCRQDFGRLLQAFEGTPLPKDPVARIRALGRAYARFGLENPNHYRFMFMSPMKPDHAPEPTDPGHQSFEVLRAAVADALAEGAFRKGDVDTVAQVLWAQIHGAVALLITLRPDCWPRPPVRDLVDLTIEAGIRAFLARPLPA